MSRLPLLATAAALAFAIASVAPAHAWVKSFEGTRGQVRSACSAVGGELIEGGTNTTCFNHKNGTGVSCGDDGKCTGSGPGQGPNRAADVSTMLGTIVAPTTGTKR
ncbi:MAG: hypothetical protein EOP22_13990 [Hyphomicrobiales bacterium]|nr:MAG: hypothetical protein EOP22_13990 [Hyphomicrobiales bacterium]